MKPGKPSLWMGEGPMADDDGLLDEEDVIAAMLDSLGPGWTRAQAIAFIEDMVHDGVMTPEGFDESDRKTWKMWAGLH